MRTAARPHQGTGKTDGGSCYADGTPSAMRSADYCMVNGVPPVLVTNASLAEETPKVRASCPKAKIKDVNSITTLARGP